MMQLVNHRYRHDRARRTSERLRARFYPEALESRSLLTTTAPGALAALANITVAPANQVIVSPLAGNTSTNSGMTPSQVLKAYGFNSLSADGTGETIAIVDAYNAPTIKQDLATFDAAFGLPAPASFSVVSQTGSSSALPATDTGWASEISLDVEWAHAIAPKASILLVEANSSSLTDLLAAVKYASTTSHANVVSMSWGSSEFNGEQSYDSYFNVPGVTFVASSGDSGGSGGAEWPAASPNVVSVGGTTLSVNSSGAYSSESTWLYGGGGVSRYESVPTYQSAAGIVGTTTTTTGGRGGFRGRGGFGGGTITTTGRSTPDVAYNGDPNSGFAVYDSTPDQGFSGWYQVGGTSAGAPQWAALIAMADQTGGKSLSSASTLSLLYAAAKTEGQSTPSTLFHDITRGSNFTATAATGYDTTTGLGTPIANNLVQYLATGKIASAAVSAGITTVQSTHTTSTTAGTLVVIFTPTQTGLALAAAELSTPQTPTFFVPLTTNQANQGIANSTATSSSSTATTSSFIATTSARALPAQPQPTSTKIGTSHSDDDTPIRTPNLHPDALPAPGYPGDPNPESPMVPAGEGDFPLDLLPMWDEALTFYSPNESGWYRNDGPQMPAATLAAEPAVSTLEGSLAAGAVIALWGLHEFRTRRLDNRSRRTFLGR